MPVSPYAFSFLWNIFIADIFFILQTDNKKQEKLYCIFTCTGENQLSLRSMWSDFMKLFHMIYNTARGVEHGL